VFFSNFYIVPVLNATNTFKPSCRGWQQRGPAGHTDPGLQRSIPPNYFTNSISPGRQVFSIQGFNGEYMRRITNQLLPETVSIQLFS